VESIAAYLREQGEPRYVDGITEAAEDQADVGAGGLRSGADDLYERAVAIVLEDQKASTSYLQRRLGVGYNKAADLIERMEREGVLSPPGHQGKRQILGRATPLQRSR
jgi:S-DNA-T family DNA segregation ATPase FtsK/SpoIIIE